MKTKIIKTTALLTLLMGVGWLFPNTVKPPPKAKAEEPKAKLAIVIDDFGQDRHGVEEMLNLPIRLTVAVMPEGEYTVSDAETAHSKGHQVILHMPMENETYMPASYYGPVLIKNGFTKAEAVETLSECMDKLPYCDGVNIHMGTGVSHNKELMTAMMEEVKRRDKFFLDSKTTMGSVCPECAEATGVKFAERDVFLEPPGRPNYATAVEQLLEAGRIAKQKGNAVAIGHVGPVGKAETARAIKDTLPELEAMGVEIVPLSDLVG